MLSILYWRVPGWAGRGWRHLEPQQADEIGIARAVNHLAAAGGSPDTRARASDLHSVALGAGLGGELVVVEDTPARGLLRLGGPA